MATTEHGGESGGQLSVGAKREAYGDEAAPSSNNLGRGKAGIPAIANIEWYNWQDQIEATRFCLTITFRDNV